ncbi:hypothetical protein GCM10023334_067640 [Nonomuraea thailandensis]
MTGPGHIRPGFPDTTVVLSLINLWLSELRVRVNDVVRKVRAAALLIRLGVV